MFSKTLSTAGIFFALMAFAVPFEAAAASPKSLGTFKDWNAFKLEQPGNTVCFVVSEPKDMKPANVRRGEVYFLITAWGEKRDQLEPSLIIGYPYKAGSTATIAIGSDKFELFTKDDGAWLRDAKSEERIVSAMKRGASMVVTGTSQRGTLTTDRYSLSGVTAALEKIVESCN